MIFENLLNKTVRTWRGQDAISKLVIITSLLLVVLAYLPTLQFDYVTQDQWRAFRYSIDGEPALERAKLCADMVSGLYVQTGRPLIWFTECIGHAGVLNISDFAYFRPVLLVIALVTVMYLGFVLSSLVGGLATGVATASALVFAPGYSFMFLQGMPAAMVLIAVILAAASFSQYSQRNKTNSGEFKRILLASLFFVLACMIYPAYAFMVLPLALIEFSFSSPIELSKRLKNLFSTLIFYFGNSILYYVLVKASVSLLEKTQDLGEYEVSVQLTPAVLWERVLAAATYFYSMPPLNFSTPPGATLIILVALSLISGWLIRKKRNESVRSALIFSIVFLSIASIVLLASASPWLFSKMGGLSTRHIFPWYLFFCSAISVLLSSFFKLFLNKYSKWTSLAALLLIVLPTALVQNRLSTLEAVVTGVEIQAMRSRISEWVDQKGWVDNRFLFVVLPKINRPVGIENMLKGSKVNHENAVLASAYNPVSVLWMVHALLRERADRPKFNLVYCAFDQECADKALEEPKNIVLGYAYGQETIISNVEPFIINFSELTSKPVKPKFSRIKPPKISASSTLGNYGPSGLFASMDPGWHAELNPKYPQEITVDFNEVKPVNNLAILPQDGLVVRMPKTIKIMLSEDGASWVSASTFENNCLADQSNDGWHNIKLDGPRNARFVKLEILSNCGAKGLLTLKGLRID